MSLEAKARYIRKNLFEMVLRADKGHYPSGASMTEILVALYYGGVMNWNPKDPERDRLLVSKGHAAMALYPVLSDLGFFSPEEMNRVCQKEGILRLYADPSIPGIESVTGSLGHGFGIGCGIALAQKLSGSKARTFVILGDGELWEGSVWEAAMFAAHQKLSNLTVILDRNQLCILNDTESCMKLEPIRAKWDAFGWCTFRVNGHSLHDLLNTLYRAHSIDIGYPNFIIADTIKGKGISFMEGRSEWHNKIPTRDQIEIARQELA